MHETGVFNMPLKFNNNFSILKLMFATSQIVGDDDFQHLNDQSNS